MTDDNHSQIFLMLGQMDGKLDGIYEQAKKTNGRVNKHDDEIKDINKVQNQQLGRNSIISIVFGTVGALLMSLIKSALS